MTQDNYVEPIQRLRQLAAAQARTEREELAKAYADAVREDVKLTLAQRDELETKIGEHSVWLEKNEARLEALLPKLPLSLVEYDQKKGLYRNQISHVLQETKQISVNSLWGTRADGRRDPAAFSAIVSGVRNRLGQCRGLPGALDRCFLQVEVELLALERRGFGLPPAEQIEIKTKAPSKKVKIDSEISHFD